MTDDQIENEIQAKGLTAPRVTPADIEANIARENYFTAADGVRGRLLTTDPDFGVDIEKDDPRSLLTFCVLVLRNGFTVVGKSACASPENFDAELGKKIARQDAVNQMWPLMGYALRERLSSQAAERKDTPTADTIISIPWAVIDSNPLSLPAQSGSYLVTVDTDGGRQVHTLEFDDKGRWVHEGEYTFQHGFYFRPIAWAPLPPAYAGDVGEGD